MCTNLTIAGKSKDYPMISARTMDFPRELSTSLHFIPRFQSFPEIPLPEEIRWENKYAFIGAVHALSGEIGYSDGLNEAGLSAAALWLDCSMYPKPAPPTPILCNHNVVSYVLGNFDNVNKVKDELSKITVIDIGRPFATPLHFIFSDALGNHLIVEFIDGEMKTYKNNVGVLTNDPAFDWHLTNLRNYETLSLENNPKISFDGEFYGSGQLGSPGDPTSPSRFVRAELLRRSGFHPKNTQQSIGLALQILQTIAVPCGTVMMNGSYNEFDWTQWCIIRDHTNRSIYFNTDFNSTLYGIHLKELDVNGSERKSIDIIQPDWYVDVTKKLESV
ncbi:linear amide C-N hydrolase [Candidatus Formimonas warabiya]|uniref:Choloylglycine hydrolase/NAAA C-terminal domain-containing protein n=1 Tax=Formimonas warabiya TaxID=1761012 RepID=A0A3G1KTK6_FORW1|nr:linear amide C-N hydrolase [Candidatus Formimonas warabiya]ATW25767.1 hypothetical protein DCMF_14235 [Candidatus Formimonas warabiya]